MARQRRGASAHIEGLAGHALIGFEGIMQIPRVAKWLPVARIVSRNDSLLGPLSAAKAGIGVARLPTTPGDAEEELVQILPPVSELTRSWHVLTHPDLCRTPRIAVFVDLVPDDVPALRTALIG